MTTSTVTLKGPGTVNPEQHGVSLVVISDEGIPAQALVHLLKARPGYNVVGESTIAGAESMVWDPPPDVAVIHVGAAGLHILGLVQALRARSIPTVMLLRHRSPWLVHACHRAGAVGLVHLESRSVHLFGALQAAAMGKSFIDPSLSEAVLETAQGPNGTFARELSARESQVLKYLAYGYNNAQIARKLNVSTKSVETYRARIMEKLQLKDRTDLVRFALITGVLAANDLCEDMAS